MLALQSKLLKKIPNLIHGFTHRKMPAAELTLLQKSIFLPLQVHKDTILWTNTAIQPRPEADAIATTQNNFCIGVQSADCVPILLAAVDRSKQAKAIIAIHAGWRGTRLKIVEKALASVQKKFTMPNHEGYEIYACIGPCISQKAYEVGIDVAQHFSKESLKEVKNPDKNATQKYLLNLLQENETQLNNFAKKHEISIQIDSLHNCTFSQPEYFPSYRRDGANQDRILSFLSLNSNQ